MQSKIEKKKYFQSKNCHLVAKHSMNSMNFTQCCVDGRPGKGYFLILHSFSDLCRIGRYMKSFRLILIQAVCCVLVKVRKSQKQINFVLLSSKK